MKKRLFSLSFLIIIVFYLILSFLPIRCGNGTSNQIVVRENIDYIEISINDMQKEMNAISYILNKEQWFIEYKNIVDKYKDILDPPLTIYDYFTEEEIYLMQRVVETECYDQDFLSKCNVASVIFNRLEYKGEEYPEFCGLSLEDIVTKDNQFVYWRTDIAEETILAVEYAFEIEDTTNGALFFHSGSQMDSWYGATWFFQDEAGHHFYGIK